MNISEQLIKDFSLFVLFLHVAIRLFHYLELDYLKSFLNGSQFSCSIERNQ